MSHMKSFLRSGATLAVLAAMLLVLVAAVLSILRKRDNDPQ